MALSCAERKRLLALNLGSSQEIREALLDYLSRTGLMVADFAHRINYSTVTLIKFVGGRYQEVAGNDRPLCAAIMDFLARHPVAVTEEIDGPIYETRNVKILRRYFEEALELRRAIYVHGAPGSQKTFVLKHLIAELNRSEISKNGKGRRAYYVRCRQDIRPLDLVRRIAEAAGAPMAGGVDRILRNLRFELRGRKVLLVFDEAQHLNVAGLEIIRELLDEPPHCGMLFAGSHELDTAFVKHAIQLEQWKSRFHRGASLPGIGEDEAEKIIRGELGARVNKEVIGRLTRSSRARDLRAGGEHQYISARRLFWSIAEIQQKIGGKNAMAPEGETHAGG